MENAGKLDQWQSALGGKSATEEPLSPASEDSEDVLRAENSVEDGSEPSEQSSEDTPPDSMQDKEGQASPDQKAQTSAVKEVITVTDETGRRRKVEIDYSDKAAVKKAFLEAAGMRKFQADRDQVISSKKALEGELGEYKNNWNILESAFRKGKSELFDMLEGRQGAFKDYVKQQVERELFLREASPHEIKALEEKEQADLTRRELDQMRKENSEFQKKMTEERETAELRSVESKVHPVFDKYRFAEKLNSSEDEQMFDEMLWNTALKRLEPYEKEGLDLSPELIDREFRAVASSLRKRIGVQAEKKASKVVEQKKQEATENVQSKIKSGYNTDSDNQRLQKLIKSGDTGSIFKQWSTFSKILGNKGK